MTIDVNSAEVKGFIRSLFEFDESGIPSRAIWHKDEVEYLIDTNAHYPTCRDLSLPSCLAGLDHHDKKLLKRAYMELLIPGGDEFGLNVLPDTEFDASVQVARLRARSVISRMDQDFEQRASQLSDSDRILLEAQRGSPSSQTIMGKAYLRGWFGLEVDGEKAANWLSKAAAQGDPEACWELAHARVKNAATGANECLISSSDQRDEYERYAWSLGLERAKKDFLHRQSYQQEFIDSFTHSEEMNHENRMVEIENCLAELHEENFQSLSVFVQEIESEIQYRKAAFDPVALQAEKPSARRRASSAQAKFKRMYDEIPELISIARRSLLEAAEHTAEASFLLAASDILVDSWSEKRDFLMKAAFPPGDMPPSADALVEVTEMSLAKGMPDYDPARAMRCLELARASGRAWLKAAVAQRYADHLLTEFPDRPDSVEEARRIYADEMEESVNARLMNDFLELKSHVRGVGSCATDLFSCERIRLDSKLPFGRDVYVSASCRTLGVPGGLMRLMSSVHRLPIVSWKEPLVELLEHWWESVGQSHAAPFRIDAEDVRALECIGAASNVAKVTSNELAGICDDPIGDLGQSAEVVALVCNALASGDLDERSARQLAVDHQSLIAGYLLVSWAALGKTTLAENEVDEVIGVAKRRAQSYARKDAPGFAGPDGESEWARWFADSLSNCSIRYKNIVLEARNRELLQARNDERQARDDVERRQRDLENLMTFVSHEFRGCVQSISDSAANETAPDPSFFADQARKLSGFLELFSLMGSNPDRLKQKLRSDDSGPRDLEQTLDISLWLALSQLLTPRGSGRISRHTLRHSIETGRVSSDATLKQWRINADYRRVRQDVERDWSNQVRLLAQAGDLTPLRIWFSQFFVPLEISELKTAQLRFSDSGSKEGLLTIVMTEMLVNAVTYYDVSSRLPVRMQWRESNAQACLVCTNPTSEAIRAQSHGSHGGLDSLKLLAEKIGGLFSFTVEDCIAMAAFVLPTDLIRGSDVVVSMG